MSQFGKDNDPTKRSNPDTGVGGAQKDCDSCGHRDHTHASLVDNWDQTKQSASNFSDVAKDKANRAQEKSGGILRPK